MDNLALPPSLRNWKRQTRQTRAVHFPEPLLQFVDFVAHNRNTTPTQLIEEWTFQAIVNQYDKLVHGGSNGMKPPNLTKGG